MFTTLIDAVLNVRQRLSRFHIEDSTADLKCRNRAADDNVNVCCFTSLRDLDHRGLLNIGYGWIKSLAVRRSRAARKRVVLADRHFVRPCAQAKSPVDTSVVCVQIASESSIDNCRTDREQH